MGSYKEDIEYAYKVLEYRDNLINNKFKNVDDRRRSNENGPIYMFNRSIALFDETKYNHRLNYIDSIRNVLSINQSKSGIYRYNDEYPHLHMVDAFVEISEEEHFLNSLLFNAIENRIITTISVLLLHKTQYNYYGLDLNYIDKGVLI